MLSPVGMIVQKAWRLRWGVKTWLLVSPVALRAGKLGLPSAYRHSQKITVLKIVCL